MHEIIGRVDEMWKKNLTKFFSHPFRHTRPTAPCIFSPPPYPVFALQAAKARSDPSERWEGGEIPPRTRRCEEPFDRLTHNAHCRAAMGRASQHREAPSQKTGLWA